MCPLCPVSGVDVSVSDTHISVSSMSCVFVSGDLVIYISLEVQSGSCKMIMGPWFTAKVDVVLTHLL
jgi:hypothetical protein